jgi:hypothetical protein
LFSICAAAEGIRLASEKGQMVYSALWQMLPHRHIAHKLSRRYSQSRYCRYYALSDGDRMAYVLGALKSLARVDPEVSNRLDYLCGFWIVPDAHGLRCDHVRDVARGEVFIHRSWTADPGLLIGQGLRRAPWMFDPRYLPRPFYYRTQSNRLATLFVLRHARYSPLYAWYQFGHEIKVARYDLLYRLLRWLGWDVEQQVQADGTYPFDPLLDWIEKKRGQPDVEPGQRPLWSDSETVQDVAQRIAAGEALSALDIATQYTYPLKYVDEVLMGKIQSSPIDKSEWLETALQSLPSKGISP